MRTARLHGATKWLLVGACALTVDIGTGSARADVEVADAGTGADASAYRAEAGDSLSSKTISSLIERLVVSARRREEPIQQIPIAVTALTGDELERTNRARRLQDIQNLVPSLVFDGSVGFSSTSRVILRGFGQADPSPTSEPGVGIYVDGVYQARSTGLSSALVDIDRIEVVRGPQGTLFGKNTVGGAINVTTHRPDFEFGGDAEVRVGNFDSLELRSTLNVPIVPEKSAVRVSLSTATRDGYLDDHISGDDLGDNKTLAGRVQLLALPNPDVELLVSLDKSRENRTPLGARCVVTGKGSGIGGLIAQQSGAIDSCRKQAALSDLTVESDVGFTEDFLDTSGATARVAWDIRPELTLTSITGARSNVLKSFVDIDATAVPLFENDNNSGRETDDQLSQELQLAGQGLSSRLRYVLGVYGLKDDVQSREFISLGLLPGPTGMLVRNPTLTSQQLKVHNISYAVYGQGVYALTDQLDLTLGARLTDEGKRVRASTRPAVCRPGAAPEVCRQILAQPPMAFTGFQRSARFRDVSPMAALSYKATPDLLLYASYGTAFQSGGFQGSAQSLQDSDELDPQDVTSYELGIKSTWFDNRLVLNAASFYNVVNDSRVVFTNVTADGNVSISERNAARTLIRGADLEAGFLVVPGLQLLASGGIIDSKFDRFDSDFPRQFIQEGERTPFTPSFTLNLQVDYARSLGTLGTLGLRSSWSERGRMNNDAQATDVLQSSKYGLLDGRVSLALADGRTEFAAFGTNLLDRRYISNGVSFADTFGLADRFFGPPRMYGVELRRRF